MLKQQILSYESNIVAGRVLDFLNLHVPLNVIFPLNYLQAFQSETDSESGWLAGMLRRPIDNLMGFLHDVKTQLNTSLCSYKSTPRLRWLADVDVVLRQSSGI